LGVPYPKKLLNDGEEVALDLRPHWWFFSKHIASGIPLFVIIIVILSQAHGDARKWLFLVWALVAVVWAVWLGLKYLEWNFTHFVVTDDRVIYRTGVLAKRGVEIPMERINNINFHQGMWERVIGAGDLDIESAGRDGQSHFDFIRHPDGVQHEIYRQMEARNMPVAMMQQAPAAPTPQPGQAVPEQIEQLARLRDQGHITEAEFETKKSELLGRM
jgi:uncharacterized membrane protein YdbT with pleckstrin-like domain